MLVACGAGSKPDYLSAEEFCAADCARWGECFGLTGSEITDCRLSCLRSGWPQRIRQEVLTAYAECLDRLTCTAFDNAEIRDNCFYDAFEGAEPSDACAKFCEVEVAKAFECGYRYGISDCLKYNCGVVDSILDEATDCVREPVCEEWRACEDAVFSFD